MGKPDEGDRRDAATPELEELMRRVQLELTALVEKYEPDPEAREEIVARATEALGRKCNDDSGFATQLDVDDVFRAACIARSAFERRIDYHRSLRRRQKRFFPLAVAERFEESLVASSKVGVDHFVYCWSRPPQKGKPGRRRSTAVETGEPIRAVDSLETAAQRPLDEPGPGHVSRSPDSYAVSSSDEIRLSVEPSAETNLIAAELKDKIDAIASGLLPGNAEFYELRQAGLNAAEIAELLEIGRAAVSRRNHRTKEAFRAQLPAEYVPRRQSEKPSDDPAQPTDPAVRVYHKERAMWLERKANASRNGRPEGAS